MRHWHERARGQQYRGVEVWLWRVFVGRRLGEQEFLLLRMCRR
jgi:hypothetical protein